MKILFDLKGINNRFKIVKKNQRYYIFSRKYFLFWISDGHVYVSRQEAKHSLPLVT